MASDLSSPPFTSGTHALPLSPHDFPVFPYGTSSLSLHEYRQHQRGVEPSTSSHSRKVKRKRASSNLNAGQQYSGSSLLNRSRSSAPLAFGWDHSVDLADSFTYPQSYHPYSFATVLRPHYSQPLRSKTFDWSESNQIAGDRSEQIFKGKLPLFLSFKPPPGLFEYESAVSERGGGQTTSSASSDGQNVSQSPFSYPSDFSLSRFPIPPNTCEPTPPNSREGIAPIAENKSPTVYHLRGASFDFVNPRTSLRLEDIETPAELDQDFVDYFHTTLSMENRAKAKLVDITTPKKGDRQQMEIPRAKSTPPRALFEDLPTAYNSITARNGDFKPSPLNDVPLPPTPLPVREPGDKFESLEPFDTQLPTEPPEFPFPMSRHPLSIRSRLSHLFRFNRYGNEAFGSSGRAMYEEDLEAMLPPTSSHVEVSGTGLRRSMSDGNLSRQSQNESFYVPSFNAEDDLGYNGPFQEDGDEDYEDTDRSHFSESHNEQENLSLPRDQNTGLSANSTIGDILDQYRRPDNSSPMKSERSPSDSVRRATNRALFGPPGTAPTCALPPPPPPTFQVRPSTPYFPTRLSEDTVHASAMSNYSDTRNLLYASGSLPSVEASRGATTSKTNFQPDMSSSPSTPPYIADVERRLREEVAREQLQLSPTADSLLGRLSPSEINEQIQRDLKRLSAVSGSSSVSGNVLVFKSFKNPPQVQHDRDESGSSQGSVRTSNSGSSASQEVFKVPRPVRTSNFAPVAAFSRNAIQPGMNRLASFERNALDGPGLNSQPKGSCDVKRPHAPADRSFGLGIDVSEDHSNYDNDNDGCDQDWETIGDSRTHQSFQTSDSWQDDSSINNSNPFAPVSVHPADGRYEHVYRMQSSPDSNDSFMVPSYSFGEGSGFPNRNALTAPIPTIYTGYIPPSPLPPSHVNPFTSSPPQIDKKATETLQSASTIQHQIHQPRLSAQSQAQNTSLPPFNWPRANLSVVHEHSGEVPHTPIYDKNINCTRQVYTFDEYDLSSEPGPEISTAALHGSSVRKETQKMEPRPAKLASGINGRMVEELRRDDPRMGSSPLSETNSFAKLSTLGPKANLTGTPNGTGMRHAGSSLVGSSSPLTPPKSTPVRGNTDSTPPARNDQTPSWARATPQDDDIISPVLSNKSPRSLKWGSLPLQFPKSAAFRKGRHSRAAVGGQTQLMEMSLSPGDQHGDSTRATVLPSTMTRGGYEIEFGRRHVGATELSDHEKDIKARIAAFVQNHGVAPELHPSRWLASEEDPSGYPDLKRRQNLISWIVFAICAPVPPLLMVYGYGLFDTMIASITEDRIRHFGSRQKFWAKLVGISVTFAVVAVTAILLILVKATQNNFP